uniref:G-protein coupled receptors family 1 profile domain-containing protein n=1 Tax=Romanomermis culicivorax TaxID=13658 RepID=A0A915HGC4_ROMCU
MEFVNYYGIDKEPTQTSLQCSKMAFGLEIYDSESYTLDYIIYILHCIGCVLVLFPFLFVLHCACSKPRLRSRRTIFTIYITSIDFLGRFVYLIYFVLRLLILDGRIDKVDVDHDFCDLLTFGLFNAASWPLTSSILLQLHIFLAICLSYDFYERIFSLAILFDFWFSIPSYGELTPHAGKYYYSGCKFEYFSRFSEWNGWKLFAELLIYGFLALGTLIGRSIKKKVNPEPLDHNSCERPNPAGNSPFHNFHLMSQMRKFVTISTFVLSLVGFFTFIAAYAVFLIEGNTLLCRILTLSVTIFSFITPVQMIFVNSELRDEFLSCLLH